jgi:hypothetical protein
MVKSKLLGFALVALVLGSASPSLAQKTEVDLSLVLAVDISNSMDVEEQQLQREGFVAAFRSPEVHDAIRKGALGRIAVTYMEWAGSHIRHVVTPWTIISDSAEAVEFSDRLAAAPVRRGPRTSISGALDHAILLLDAAPVESVRQVIDVSGDGPNNQGRIVTVARDEALQRGVTINGLPIMLKRGGAWDIDELDDYYRDCVIGGPGAFLIPIRTRDQFPQAIRTKIIREIADLGAPLLPTRVQAKTTDCAIGELRSNRWGN